MRKIPKVKLSQRQSYIDDKGSNVLILIKDIKARQNLLDRDVAQIMGLPLNTFRARKQHPEEFRFREIWPLMQAAKVQDERKIEIL